MPRAMKDSGIKWIGEIPADWEVIVSRFVFDQISDVDHYMPESVCDGIPYVMTGDLKKCLSAINFDSCKKISLEDYLKLNKKVKLAVGDIIFARYATIGTVCYVDFKLDCVISYSCVIIKPTKEKLFGKYLYHYLQSSAFFEDISQYINSNTQSNVGIEALYKVKIPVPPLDEQQRIADYLDVECARIDSIVEKTRASIVEYKKLKQALITRAVTKGIRPNRPMKDSGIEWLGDIPADWDVVNIRKLFSFGKGLPITKEDLRESGLPVISYGQIHSKFNSGTTITSELIRFVDDDYLQSYSQSLVKCGDFIFADTSEDLAGCGNCVYVDTDERIFAGYHTIILRNKTCSQMKYFAVLFQSDAWRKQIRERVTGVKLFSISQKILRATSVIIPPLDEQKEIAAYLDGKTAAIDSLIEKKGRLVTELERLKKSLIFEYVTGKKEAT